MLTEEGLHAALPGARSIETGVRLYHSFRGYKEQEETHGVVAWRVVPETAALSEAKLNHQQMDFLRDVRCEVERSFAISSAATEREAREAALRQSSVHCLFGPPGTGKTTVTLFAVEEVLKRGGYVLWAVYTAQLASRMKERFQSHPYKRYIRIDTCHAAFGLDDDEV